MFYKKIPDDTFDSTTTLGENLNNEVKEKGSIHHLPNYFNKYTYYSPFLDKILPLEAKYVLDALIEFYIQQYTFIVTRYLHGGHYEQIIASIILEVYKLNMAWIHTKKSFPYNTILSKSPDTHTEVTRSKENHP